MRKYIVFLFCFISHALYAEMFCTNYLSAELWSDKSASKILGADLAFNGCPTAYTAVHVGLTYFVDSEDVYKGLVGSFRLQKQGTISPFVGVGGLLGVGEDKKSLLYDGVDNNHNGIIDDASESENSANGRMFLFPEMGITFNFTQSIGATISVKKYYGEYFQAEPIIGAGLVFKFD